ncbi:MAG: hypothetical protein ACXABN_05420 [Candidatus Thorarchaeota archaeon]|jgi:hypothetical protein
MTEEEKYRIEAPDEEPEEKKGFYRPLPEREEKRYVDKDGRPQPIVKLLGFSMSEKTRDRLLVILIPALVGLMNTTIYSMIITNQVESAATYLFFIPIIVAIPIGLTASDAGRALVGGFLGSMFFLLFFIFFLISPGIILPELGIGQFFFSAMLISVGYFILIIVANLLGAVIGIILREFA